MGFEPARCPLRYMTPSPQSSFPDALLVQGDRPRFTHNRSQSLSEGKGQVSRHEAWAKVKAPPAPAMTSSRARQVLVSLVLVP
jgi:hypothetical protein